MAAHPISHIDFVSDDPKVASQFYADLFGWRVIHNEEFNYFMFQAEGGPGGGFVTGGYHGTQAGDALVHVDTDDIDATLRRVEELGGTVAVPKVPIPGVGWYAIFRDAAGGRCAVFQAGSPEAQ